MSSGTAPSSPSSGLPSWSRFVLAAVPLRESRGEVESDFAELFIDRSARYGRWHAHRRLLGDIVSLWRGMPRGGHVFQDLRFGLRLFRKHPAPVGLAIAGLGLAIGVVTAVFSLVNATMLRPFGMDDPSTVVQVTTPWFGERFTSEWPYARFLDMRAAKSFAKVEAAMLDKARLSTTASGESGAERDILFVSGGYLQTLGGRPAVGRSLTPADDRPGAPPVVVISHDLWTSEFQSDAARIGSTVWFNGAPATLVGVLQPGFSSPIWKQPSVWAPFAAFDDLLVVAESYIINGRNPASMAGEPFGPASRTQVAVLARLVPGTPAAAAEAELEGILTRAAANTPGADPKTKPTVVRIFSAATPVDGPEAAESYLEIAGILGLVGLVLAVACANTANLLLAAAATRAREIGVRLALGATRKRLLLQMVTESLTLGLVAGGLGFLFALWLSPLLGRAVGIESGVSLTPDLRVLAFAIVVAVVCGVGAGVAPARFGARGNVLAVLQSQSGAGGRATVPSRLRSSFIGLQAAVSMLLLVGAALLVRTAIHVTAIDSGFDAGRLLTASITTPEVGPATRFDEPAYFRRAVDAVRAIPSVEAVGMIEKRPFGGSRDIVRVPGLSDAYTLLVSRTDAGYFQAAGIRLLRGRFFTEEEAATTAPLALISNSVARRFFHDRDPIGQQLSGPPEIEAGLFPQDKAVTIIGIVADAMLERVYTEGFGTIYRPIRRVTFAAKGQTPTEPPTLMVRSARPAAVAREVEEVLRRLDSRARPRTWLVRDDLDDIAAGKQTLAWLAAPLAALALILAALGIYGVTAFVASRRTQEVSVRMAMGASGTDVLRLLVRDGLRPVVIGLCVGLVVAIGAARVFASMFAGISPNDPVAIAVSVVTLLGSALIAVVIPARGAARVDPASILRQS
ncbi:MAG TPA: ADOP family duplicated permease [Vicinamibacterales bacterium]|nr:ADOP family duplicated permease [Vicinamibacterales bacterium]